MSDIDDTDLWRGIVGDGISASSSVYEGLAAQTTS